MTSEQFVSWLEGYLDATNGNLTKKHIKQIRVKLEEAKLPTQVIPYFTTTSTDSDGLIFGNGQDTISTTPFDNTEEEPNNFQLNDAQKELVDSRKECATLEDLEKAHEEADAAATSENEG